jgi:hypothetical protein
VDASLTLLNWPEAPDDELISTIFEVIPAPAGGNAPIVLGERQAAHLAWRGRFDGGVLGMYRALDPLFRRRGVAALYGSPTLEVFVPAFGDVMVLGSLRQLPREQWDAWVESDDRDEQLANRLGNAAAGSLADVRERWAGVRREAGALCSEACGSDRAALDFDLIAGCHLTLSEWYDGDGVFGEAWASYRGARHRTDFLAPGSEGVPGQEIEESLTWRVAQWDHVEGAAPPRPLACSTHSSDLLADDGWRLRAWAPLGAVEVCRLLPKQLAPWVARATENGVATAQWLTRQTPTFAPLALSLREQLRELRP